MRLSIVTTLYRSSSYVSEFVERITRAAGSITPDFELLLVNDGSPDDSLDVARRLAGDNTRISVVNLSRNFGHHNAAVAGLAHAQGELVFLIDVDLEESPELLASFHELMKQRAVDVVFGVQRDRAGGWFRRQSGGLFYRLFNFLSDVAIPHNLCTVRLMSRRYVDALLTLRDRNLFLAGNFAWTGFSQLPVTIDKSIRESGSSYSLARRLKLFLNAITSFSSYPLYLLFCMGMAICLLSSAFAAWLLIQKLVSPEAVLIGWASVMVSVWFIGGVVISSIGIVALYIGRIFSEVKDRPQYIVESVYCRPRHDESDIDANPTEFQGEPVSPIDNSSRRHS